MKRILRYCIILIGTVGFAQIDLDQNLLVHYPFDGNTEDASINELDGTGNASLTTDRFGNVNAAYQFNGVDQFIDMPNEVSLKPQLPISFSFWINFEDVEVTKTFAFTNDFTENLITGINLSLTGGSNVIAMSYGDGGGPSPSSRRTKIGTTLIEVNEWYLVIAVIKDALDMDIFIGKYGSGTLECLNDGGTYSGSGSSIQYGSKPGSIGRTDANNSVDPYYFQGKIDDFRMWDKALSSDEIEELCKIQNENTLNINDVSLGDIKIFHDRLNDIVHLKSTSLNHSTVIYNVMGQIVLKKDNVKEEIDVSILKPGVYFLKAMNPFEQKVSFKFIK